MASTQSLTTSSEAPDPSTPLPNGRCVWWSLPRELRDSIYKIAYTREAKMRILTKPCWIEMEYEMSRRARQKQLEYIPKPFLYCVDRFLINKQYAREAYATFVSTTHFDFHLGAGGFAAIYGNSLRDLTTLTIDFESFMCDGEDLAKQAPHLRRMTLVASMADFEFWMSHEEQESAADFMSNKMTEATVHSMSWWDVVKRIRGLEEVTFSGEHSKEYFPGNPSEKTKQTMRDNVKIVKAALTKSFMRPKETTKSEAKEVMERAETTIAEDVTIEEKSDQARQKTASSSSSETEATHVAVKQPGSQPKEADFHIADEDLPADDDILKLVLGNPKGAAAWMGSARMRLKTDHQEG